MYSSLFECLTINNIFLIIGCMSKLNARQRSDALARNTFLKTYSNR
jgi:hypothetical protein